MNTMERTNIIEKAITSFGLAQEPSLALRIDKELSEEEQRLGKGTEDGLDSMRVVHTVAETLTSLVTQEIISRYRDWSIHTIKTIESKLRQKFTVTERLSKLQNPLQVFEIAESDLFEVANTYKGQIDKLSAEIRHTELLAAHDARYSASLRTLKRECVCALLLKAFSELELPALVEATIQSIHDLEKRSSDDESVFLNLQKILVDESKAYAQALDKLGCDGSDVWIKQDIRANILSYAVHSILPQIVRGAIGSLGQQDARAKVSDMIQKVLPKIPVPPSTVGHDLQPFISRIGSRIWSGLVPNVQFITSRPPIATIRVHSQYVAELQPVSVQGASVTIIPSTNEPEVLRMTVTHFVNPEMILGFEDAFPETPEDIYRSSAEPWEYMDSASEHAVFQLSERSMCSAVDTLD